MEIIWTRSALRRLDEIGTYIASRNPQAAGRMMETIRQSVLSLRLHPGKGRAGRVIGTHELIVQGMPYIVAYRVRASALEVLTVLHGAQQWPDEFASNKQ